MFAFSSKQQKLISPIAHIKNLKTGHVPEGHHDKLNKAIKMNVIVIDSFNKPANAQ